MAAATEISRQERDLLQGLYVHCYGVQHNGCKANYDFYVKQLDEAGISWRLQNIVSAFADDRKSRHKYFNTLLKEQNILIAG
tara:strand:+ start:45 stop:290 length:246 start_codon:yes stop_codon:yes gene_type:complete